MARSQEMAMVQMTASGDGAGQREGSTLKSHFFVSRGQRGQDQGLGGSGVGGFRTTSRGFEINFAASVREKNNQTRDNQSFSAFKKNQQPGTGVSGELMQKRIQNLILKKASILD